MTGVYLSYLVTSPKNSGKEQYHASDGEKSTDEINLLDNISTTQPSRVDSRGREVEDGRHDEADKSPESAEQSYISPG